MDGRVHGKREVSEARQDKTRLQLLDVAVSSERASAE